MTLLMRDQENMEIGMEIGMETGMEIGKIYGAIDTCREFGLSEDTILKKLKDNYQLTERDATIYMKDTTHSTPFIGAK